ncbi:protein PTST, chloroplastic [Rhododendron vialii]|uniref:protein PTST, chloroplastic n=1 Tax=Rhododendron vialii TaxID=182163 RepID=UPI00265D6F30|nr:protein PTST, chloroplastic [Rhododendron vialii]
MCVCHVLQYFPSRVHPFYWILFSAGEIQPLRHSHVAEQDRNTWRRADSASSLPQIDAPRGMLVYAKCGSSWRPSFASASLLFFAMECHIMETLSYCPDNHLLLFPWQSRKLILERIRHFQCDAAAWRLRMESKMLIYPKLASTGRNFKHSISWRTFAMPLSLEKESSSPEPENYSCNDDDAPKTSSEELLENPLSSDELKALLADSERAKLIMKLSEANQQNRFLKRQLNIKEGALANFKTELAVSELEIQALVALAEEITKYGIPAGSRKINGKYIQSHLLSRLKAVDDKLKEHTKGVEAAQSKQVHLFWCGMAESVQVMGTFDGWSQGEHLSPEYDGSYTKFSTMVMLRPGRYEIKFLVDGEWHLSPEFPTVGDGPMKNNLLIVE